MLGWIILFALFGSVFSTIGGIFLLWKQKWTQRFSLFFISFAAGVLLGVAFLDLLPEALEKIGDIETVALYALSAIVALFLVERFLWWYHHHRFQADEHEQEHRLHGAQAYLLLTGDAIHNFVDGVLIAASFLTSFPLGVAVSLGVIAHELPQEVADFSVMIGAGFSRIKTLALNLLAALTTLLGAIIAFFALGTLEAAIPLVIAIAMGVFVYIALSDLIPEIHHESEHKYDAVHFLIFTGGIALMFFLGLVIAE